jgi:hypothetical protein
VWQGAGVGGARRPSRPPSETTSLEQKRCGGVLSKDGRFTCGGDDGWGSDVVALAAMRADVGQRFANVRSWIGKFAVGPKKSQPKAREKRR